MYIRSNKTHLSKVIFRKATMQVSGLQNLIKLLNSFSELDSLMLRGGTIFHIFCPKFGTD